MAPFNKKEKGQKGSKDGAKAKTEIQWVMKINRNNSNNYNLFKKIDTNAEKAQVEYHCKHFFSFRKGR